MCQKRQNIQRARWQRVVQCKRMSIFMQNATVGVQRAGRETGNARLACVEERPYVQRQAHARELVYQ